MPNITNNHLLFLMILIVVFVNYKINSTKKEITKETFAVASSGPYDAQITEAVKQVYVADIEAIRKLSEFAGTLTKGGSTVPGNVSATGDITTISGKLSSTNGTSAKKTDIAPNEIAFTSNGTVHYNIKNDSNGLLMISDTSVGGGIGSAGTPLLYLSTKEVRASGKLAAGLVECNDIWMGGAIHVNAIKPNGTGPIDVLASLKINSGITTAGITNTGTIKTGTLEAAAGLFGDIYTGTRIYANTITNNWGAGKEDHPIFIGASLNVKHGITISGVLTSQKGIKNTGGLTTDTLTVTASDGTNLLKVNNTENEISFGKGISAPSSGITTMWAGNVNTENIGLNSGTRTSINVIAPISTVGITNTGTIKTGVLECGDIYMGARIHASTIKNNWGAGKEADPIFIESSLNVKHGITNTGNIKTDTLETGSLTLQSITTKSIQFTDSTNIIVDMPQPCAFLCNPTMMVPIYTSIPNLSDIGLNNTITKVILLPGYRFRFYRDAGYGVAILAGIANTSTKAITLTNTAGGFGAYNYNDSSGPSSIQVYKNSAPDTPITPAMY